MAKDRIALLDVLRKAGLEGDVDFLKQAAQVVAQILIEHEAEVEVGAGLYQRSEARRNYRNGYRSREWDTRLGTLELQIPKLRQGSYFPSFLERRRRTEEALVAVIMTSLSSFVVERHIAAQRPDRPLKIVIITLFVLSLAQFLVFTNRLPWFDVFSVPPGW